MRRVRNQNVFMLYMNGMASVHFITYIAHIYYMIWKRVCTFYFKFRLDAVFYFAKKLIQVKLWTYLKCAFHPNLMNLYANYFQINTLHLSKFHLKILISRCRYFSIIQLVLKNDFKSLIHCVFIYWNGIFVSIGLL